MFYELFFFDDHIESFIKWLFVQSQFPRAIKRHLRRTRSVIAIRTSCV